MISIFPSTNSVIYYQSSSILCADIIAEKLLFHCYNYNSSPSKILQFTLLLEICMSKISLIIILSHRLKLISLNVRGLRNRNKRRAIFSYLKAQKATIFCLQETYSSPEDEKVLSAEWGGNTLFLHGSSHSRGVCILLNPSNVTFRLQSVKQDLDGRFLIAKATMHDKSFFIVNIYAPTDYRDQDNFIRTLSEQLMSNTNISNVIIAGDWNTTLNPIDKRGGQPWKATNYRNFLVNLMDELDLIDIYRQIHPTTKPFSYESKPLNLKSRIDFFVILRSISSCVKNVEIRASIAPDHKSVFLNIKVKSEFMRGPGLWKFNNTLLEDENCKDLIEFYYPQILTKYPEVVDKQLLWELIKMELRAKTIKYSKQKRSSLRNKEEALQNELRELDHKICNSDTFDQEILEKYEAA